MKKSKIRKAKQEIKKEEEKQEIQEEPITVEKIFGEKVSPFSVFEVENHLREQCKIIMDPIVNQQSQISNVLKNINATIMHLKGEVETNTNNVKDIKAELKNQGVLNKRVKEDK